MISIIFSIWVMLTNIFVLLSSYILNLIPYIILNLFRIFMLILISHLFHKIDYFICIVLLMFYMLLSLFFYCCSNGYLIISLILIDAEFMGKIGSVVILLLGAGWVGCCCKLWRMWLRLRGLVYCGRILVIILVFL